MRNLERLQVTSGSIRLNCAVSDGSSMIWILPEPKNHFGGYHTIFLGVNETPTLKAHSQTVNFSTKNQSNDAAQRPQVGQRPTRDVGCKFRPLGVILDTVSTTAR